MHIAGAELRGGDIITRSSMSTRISHRIALALFVLIAAFALMFGTSVIVKQLSSATPFARAQSATLGCLSGDAWSDNIGWIDFQCPNVTVQNDGTITGAGWANPSDDVAGSNNIGWISFNAADTAVCGSPAKLTGTTIAGWARALSADNNGWDGCISLGGTAGDSSSYGVTLPSGTSVSGDLVGNAWGSDVVGWTSFNCNAGGPTQNNICGTSNYKVAFTPTAQPPSPLAITSFYASPKRVRAGNISTLYYKVTSPPASCSIVGVTATTTPYSVVVNPTDGVLGSIATNAITANTLFTLTCGSLSASVTVGIVPVYQEK